MLVHGLGVKKVSLAIDYDSEEREVKRTVTIIADVSAEEAAQIDYLTKLNATFLADLHVEGYQTKLVEGYQIKPTDLILDELIAEVAAPSDDGKQPSEPKTRKKKEKVGTATKVGKGPPTL